MGWASGSGVMMGVIEAIEAGVENRVQLYKQIIEAFENNDWDTQDECMEVSKDFDEALKEIHPDWFEEE